MISNQIIQHVLAETAEATHVSAAIYGRDGRLIAERGDFSDIISRDISNYMLTGSAPVLSDRFYLNRISQGGETVFAAAVRKDSDNAAMAGHILSLELSSLLEVIKEEMDKESFVKNLILDNLLQIDIFNRSRSLGIKYEEPRVVYLIHTPGAEQQGLHECLLKVCESSADDFVVGTDETKQIIVHSIKGSGGTDGELRAFAERIADGVGGLGSESIIAYGAVANELKDVSKSYKEARLAYDVRSIFYEDRKIISYASLGIGRLIYQLPIRLCNMYINETFNGREVEDLDEEMLATANKFFENNLNVSETSRQLFIHRNTLVYRLDKIQKLMGLDLRVFEDAITFKIALMVGRYLNYMEKADF